MSTFDPEDDPRVVTAVVLLFSLLVLALLHIGCVPPKPAEVVDPNAPLVWELPKAAKDIDHFCLQGIENPRICRSVADVRQYLASIQAEP